MAKSVVTSAYDIAHGVSKYRAKYFATWPRLQVKYPTTACAAAQFVDGGDGTVTDNLTGLQWEKKVGTVTAMVNCSTTSCPYPHDVNNMYSWSSSGAVADGGVATDFLAKLNDAGGSGCFAGQCDWRLPTTAELMSIVDLNAPSCHPFPSASTCIDEAIFGPTQGLVPGVDSFGA